MNVSLSKETAEHLLKRLYKPEKDRNDNAVYIVDLTLACELRVALHDALDKKDNGPVV